MNNQQILTELAEKRSNSDYHWKWMMTYFITLNTVFCLYLLIVILSNFFGVSDKDFYFLLMMITTLLSLIFLSLTIWHFNQLLNSRQQEKESEKKLDNTDSIEREREHKLSTAGDFYLVISDFSTGQKIKKIIFATGFWKNVFFELAKKIIL